jgi:RNA polymerase sigma factor (sigma-70 family)
MWLQRSGDFRQIGIVDSETRFCAVFELGYAPLHRYARHRGLSDSDAEDLVAQTMEIVWRRIDDVPADEPLPWLYAIARNLWRNHYRREKRRHELIARLRNHLPSGAIDNPFDPGTLRAALASLSEKDQEILRLTAWDGLTPAQAAVVLGCTQVAARSRLHRARIRLLARLGQHASMQRSGSPRQKLDEDLDFQEML